MAEDYTHLDPGCAPDGGGVIQIVAGADSGCARTWGTEGGPETPDQVTNRAADRLLARAEQALPGLLSAVVHREVATPVTNQRHTLNPGGSWAGYDCTPDTWGRDALGTTTPVPNLFLATVWSSASWTRPPGQMAGLASGATAAEQAHHLLAGEVVPQSGAAPGPPASSSQQPPALSLSGKRLRGAAVGGLRGGSGEPR